VKLNRLRQIVLKSAVFVIIQALLFSGVCMAETRVSASASCLSPELNIPADSFSRLLQSLISGTYLRKKDLGNFGEDGFVFTDWKQQRLDLASGSYANVQVADEQALSSSFKNIPQQKVLKAINSRLAQVKDRIIQEGNGVFTEADFDVDVVVQEGAWKSATFEMPTQAGKAQGKKPILYVNKHSFRNLDFLYIVVKHELVDIKVADFMPNISPAQRELFTLITVNIEEFMKLRDTSFERAEKLLDDFRDVAHMSRGLFFRYEKLLNNKTFIDAFSNAAFHHVREASKTTLTLFEDIAYMVADEKNKSSYPQMRKAMQRLILKDGMFDPYAMRLARIQVRIIKRYVLESKNLIGSQEMEYLAGKKKKDVPAVLHRFFPYAENVQFSQDEENNNVFVKVQFIDEAGITQYVHIYLGEKDRIDSTLGAHGRIFGLALRNWRKARPDLFNFRSERGSEDWVRYRDRIWQYKLTSFVGEVSAKNPNLRKKMYANIFSLLNSLNIHRSALNNMTWAQLAGRAKEAGNLRDYEQLLDIVADHLDRIFPQEFLGFVKVQSQEIGQVQMWPLWDNPNITSKIVNWMDPDTKQTAPEFYVGANKRSIAEIFNILDKQMNIASDSASIAKPISTKSIDQAVRVESAI